MSEFIAQLRFAADRFSATADMDVQVSQGRGNGGIPDPADGTSSERKPEGLDTTRAADLAEMTPRNMRNLIIRGDVYAWRIKGGAYRVDIASLAEWIARNRTEDDHHKAA